MPSTARVAWQDVLFATGSIWVVCGPIAPLTRELVAQTLNNMASHGPKTRVGLIPASGTRYWKFDERPGDTAVDADFTFDSDDVNHMLTQLMKTSPEVPIWVAPRGGNGEYVCMRVDHGVGDAHLVIELFVALGQAAKHTDFVPPVPSSMKTPLMSCVWNATRSDPKGMWSEARELVKTAISRKRSANEDAPQEVASESQVVRAEDESATAVFVKSRVGYAEELRAYRARTKQTVSVATLVMRSLYHAFRDAGVNIADDILVMNDMRRFLPPGHWSLANLSAAVSVPVTPEMSPEEFTGAVFWQVASRKPLLRLMGRAVIARMHGLPSEVDVAQSQNQPVRSETPVTLAVSDVSRIPAIDKGELKPGFEKSEVNLAIAVVSPDPSYISVCMLNPPHDGAVHLTASFYASRLDPEVVRKALTKALETPGSPLAE